MLNSINGGQPAAWSGEGVSYLNFGTGKSFDSGAVLEQSRAYWTVLIDGWDEDVTYSADGITASHGLGYSTLGYTWSPISYYLQCGGVINNAAAVYQSDGANFSSQKTYRRYVWQMGTYFNTVKDKAANCKLTDSSDFGKQDSDILLRAQSGSCGLGKLAGQGRFPAVIVLDSDAKSAMEADRDSGTGVYSPHYLPQGSTENNKNYPVMGVAHANGATSSLWLSYIGRENGAIDSRSEAECIAEDAYIGATDCYDVLINPHGVYSNWVEGSVESFLEAPWAYEAIVAANDAEASPLSTPYGSSAAEVVQAFYTQFYGVQISIGAAQNILNGSYAS